MRPLAPCQHCVHLPPGSAVSVFNFGRVAAAGRLRFVYFGTFGLMPGMVRVIPAAVAYPSRSAGVRRRVPDGGAAGGSGMACPARSWRVRLVAWLMVVGSTPRRAPVTATGR